MGIDPDPEKMTMLENQTASQLELRSTALYGSAHLWDDGIIDPRDTRKTLALALFVCKQEQVSRDNSKTNTFGVSRF